MLKRLGMTLLLTGISLLLSGCHIEQKDVPTISRTTDTLRIYQAGDFIEYTVSASINSSPDSVLGLLRVQWDATADLINPIDNSIFIPVLKETTTLTYDSTIGAPDDPSPIIRYISQIDTTPVSPDQGSIILHAVSDGVGIPPTLYWPNDRDGISVPSSPVIAPVIFDSPLVVGTNLPVEFFMMEGCSTSTTTCGTDIYKFNDALSVDGDSTETTTNMGRFTNLFKISFVGTNTPANRPAFVLLGDIRHACGNSGDILRHSGDMFVLPEIGIIQMRNFCEVTVTPGTINNVFYSITINNTNISLP